MDNIHVVYIVEGTVETNQPVHENNALLMNREVQIRLGRFLR